MSPFISCRVSIVAEQFVRMLHHAGMPATDLDFIHGNGKVVNEILLQARPRTTLFTGSGRIAEKLAHDLHGRVSPGLRLHCLGFRQKCSALRCDGLSCT